MWLTGGLHAILDRWLTRGFLDALKGTISAQSFSQGDESKEAYVLLRKRLRTIRRRSRRLSTGGTFGFLACAAALTTMPFLLDMASWRYRAVSTVFGLIMVAAGVAAHEASRLVTLVAALEDLLFYDASLGRLDLVVALRNHVQAELACEPSWEPLVSILCKAYVTTAAVQARLLDAGIPIGYLNLGQSAADLWRDALRAAHRSQQLEALMTCVLSDERVCAYHEPLRACRASLGV